MTNGEEFYSEFLESGNFKSIKPDKIKRKKIKDLFHDSVSPVSPSFNQDPPEIDENAFKVKLTKEKKDKLYRIYYNLKQRADNKNIKLPFINFNDFLDFALQSGYTLGQRIKRSAEFNYYDRNNIIFVNVMKPYSGKKNNKYIRKKIRERMEEEARNAGKTVILNKKRRKDKIQIPEEFPE